MSQEAPPVRKNARGSVTTASVLSDDSVKEDAVKHAIPEFLKYNIVESEVRNVI